MNQQTNEVKSLTGNTIFKNEPEKAFGNELIIEKILQILIFDVDLKLDLKMVQTLRLVQKRWLNTISTLLKRTTRPIMVLRETKTLKSVEYPLSEIVEILTPPQRLIESVLPFKLILTENYFRNENDQSLLKCLTDLANGLVELEVHIPTDGVTIPLKLPRLKLKQLRKISFQFSVERGVAIYYHSDWITEATKFLLQEILNGTENLQNVIFPWMTEERMFLLREILNGTENLQNIVFPGITEEKMFQLRDVLNETENLQNFVFPRITEDRMCLRQEILNGIENIQNIIYSRITEKRILQLQEILNGTESLQNIVFQKTSLARLPSHFQSLQIPDSVTSIEIQDIYRTEYEQVLLRKCLPKLKHLTLVLSNTPSQTNGLFKILERFKYSLISLHVNRHDHDKPVVSFPKFEKLKTIKIKGAKLKSESALKLQNLFPCVTSIGLHHQTEASLSSWIQNSKFEQVKSLSLSVLNKNGQNEKKMFKSVSIQKMAQVHTAFPNLSALTITLNCKDMSGLISVYQNMVQLKSLVIYISDYCRHHLKCNYESSLIGLPMCLILEHSEDSEYFQDFVREHGKKPCIYNLFELTSFTLLVRKYQDLSAREVAQRLLNGDDDREPMFSNLLFTQAFFHMPRLQKITLSENIQPTETMEEQWKAHGRHIEYISLTYGWEPTKRFNIV